VLCSFALPAITSAQSLYVNPDADVTIQYVGPEGGPFAAQTVTSWTLDDIDDAGFDFAVSADQPWVAPAPASGDFGPLGTQTRTVTANLVAADANQLAPGVYESVVSFTNLASGAGDTSRTVQLTVAPASFSVSPPFVNGFAALNGIAPAPVTVTVVGSGSVDLNYVVDFLASSWFTASKSSGTVPAGGIDSFEVLFNPIGLDAGTHTALIRVQNATNGAGTTQVPVTLTVVSSGSGAVTLSPDKDIVVSGAASLLAPPAAQVNELVNHSDRFVLWEATASDEWLTVAPSGGELSPSGSAGGFDEQRVDIRANQGVNSLVAGVHVGTVTFENLTTRVPISTRVVVIKADPVLSLPVAIVGGTINELPFGTELSSTKQRFDLGEVVTLTANVAEGYEFAGWVADFELLDPMANPLVVAMDTSKSLGASFAPILRTLNLGFTGSGTGTVTALPEGLFTQNELITRHAAGVEVELSAEADAGATFAGWTGNVPAGRENDNPLVLVMDRDRTIAARFETEVRLTVNVSTGGLVQIEPEQASYTVGTVVTLTASPEEGFAFAGWGGDASGTSAVITVRLDGNRQVQATFSEPGAGEPEQFRLSVVIDGKGTVSPPGGMYDPGDSVLLVATPDVGFAFVGWSGDADGEDLAVSLVMDNDRSVQARFTEEGSGAPQPNPGGNGVGCGSLGLIGPMIFALYSMALVRARSRRARVVPAGAERRNQVTAGRR
jgi:hypothetical protein